MQRITVGIPSYNEGMGLVRLLRQLSGQRLDNYSICEVIVSDDSDDNTPTLVKKHVRNTPYKLILLHHNERRGVAEAWNEIFREALGDIIVLYDADVILEPDTTINLVRHIGGDVGVAASNTLPLKARTVAGKASETVARWLRRLRLSNPDAQFTVMGRGLAIRRELAKRIRIPENVIAVDLYLQLSAERMGWRVRYVDEAHVWFRPVESFRDFASQVIRAYLGHRQLRRFKGKALKWLGLREQARVFLEIIGEDLKLLPHILVSYLLTLLLMPMLLPRSGTHKWEIATTSKDKESYSR